MGGGDLNLKKSWHPSTLRNIERVWKAEQKHEVEQQKIEQLQKELAAERTREEMQTYAEDQGVVRKKEQRLDWMYQGPAAFVDREDYLMGRKIDKTLELLQTQEGEKQIEKREEDQARSVFHPSSTSVSDITVDLANKIKEDPLFEIMKHEKEERKTLLNNPVRMKQLRSLLKDSLTKSKKNKKSKKKKSKKSKHSDKSSSDSESDFNDNYNTKQKYSDKRRSTEDNYYDEKNRKKHKKHKNDIIQEHNSEKYNHKSKSKESRREQEDYYNNYNYSREQNYKHKENQVYKREQDRDWKYKDVRKSETKRKMTSEERERLLKEMMDNAKWRDLQRKTNVKRYKEENDREEKATRGSASDFIRPMLSKAAEHGTVENRVRQKIFTIQRKTSDMNSSFARR